MARFNVVSIDGIYLTQNGTISGDPCKVEVEGLDNLVIVKKRVNIQASDGEVYSQITPANNKGIVIGIQISYLAQSLYEDINTIFNNKSTTGVITLTVSGPTGIWTLSTIPAEDPIDFTGKFSGDIIENVTYRLQTI